MSDFGQQMQQRVNRCRDPEVAVIIIQMVAEGVHARWPQFDGHWDGEDWRLGRIKYRVRTKSGAAFEPGDVVLHRRVDPAWQTGGHDVAYSLRRGVDVALESAAVEELALDRVGC